MAKFSYQERVEKLKAKQDAINKQIQCLQAKIREEQMAAENAKVKELTALLRREGADELDTNQLISLIKQAKMKSAYDGDGS